MDWNREFQVFSLNNGIKLSLYKIPDRYEYDGVIYKNGGSMMRFQNLTGYEVVRLRGELRLLEKDKYDAMDIAQAIIDACRPEPKLREGFIPLG